MAQNEQAGLASVHEPADSELQSEMITTAVAAKMLGITPATLRNYAWLQSLTKRERKQRSLQEPPAGLPRPKRVRGELSWKRLDITSFAVKKQAA